eukprot:s96_g12.t1
MVQICANIVCLKKISEVYFYPYPLLPIKARTHTLITWTCATSSATWQMRFEFQWVCKEIALMCLLVRVQDVNERGELTLARRPTLPPSSCCNASEAVSP